MSSAKKVVVKIPQNSQENTYVGVSLLIEVAGLKHLTLSKKRPRHGCFPVNFKKLLTAPLFYETPLVATSDY